MATRTSVGKGHRSVPLLAHLEPQAAMFWQRGSVFSQAQVLGRIHALAAAFPAAGRPSSLHSAPQWVNLCLGRHAFMLTFCAALQRGCTNVLAADPSAGTLQRGAASFS